MAYHFNLETVLGLRRNLEELAQQRLARELALLEEQNLRLAALKRQRQELIAEFEEKKHRQMAASVFAFYMEGIFRKEQEVADGRNLVEAQGRAVARAREELTARLRDKKVMEKARDRDYRKFLQAGLKKEQNEADEQMVLRFGRKGTL
jgi:flagellar FliJ protein